MGIYHYVSPRLGKKSVKYIHRKHKIYFAIIKDIVFLHKSKPFMS